MPPEYFDKKYLDDEYKYEKSDVYSLGLTLL
jgi:hypothetical protein